MIGFPSLEGLRTQTFLYRPFKEVWDSIQTVYFAVRYGHATLRGSETLVRTPAARKDSAYFLQLRKQVSTIGTWTIPTEFIVEGVSFTVVSSDPTDRSEIDWQVSNLK